jgi:cellulose synthase/poly-beta-1,6-N-acetylglucosamine synthase-like glycosyltransferase
MELLRIVNIVLILLSVMYALMILRFTIPVFRRKKNTPVVGQDPFVTVIIAARNEEKNIGSCLDSIMAQNYPAHRFEIIVSDDHSTDHTRELVSGLRDKDPGKRITLMEAGADSPPGKKAAIERAIKRAAGEFILTTDADTLRGAGWLRSMADGLSSGGVKMVAGPVMFDGQSIFQQVQRLEFLGVMGLTAGSVLAGSPLMCNGANLLYEKAAFAGTGGFTGNLKFPSGDDQFLLAKFRHDYGREAVAFAFRREAIVATPAEATLLGFLNQRMRWVSKSKGYRDPAVILAGGITWLLQAALLAGLFAAIFHSALLPVTALCLCAKILTDFPLVLRMAVFFGVEKELWLFIPAQLFQLIYVPLAGLFGLVLPYRWKGRLISA